MSDLKALVEALWPRAATLVLAGSVLVAALGLLTRSLWRAFTLNARIDAAQRRADEAKVAAERIADDQAKLAARVGQLEGKDMAQAAELALLRNEVHEARADQRAQLAEMGRTLAAMVEGVLALVRRDPEWTAAMREAEARARDLLK